MFFITVIVMMLSLAEAKVAVTAVAPDLDSEVEARFGRTRWFAIYDPAESAWQMVDNSQASRTPGGAGAESASVLAKRGVRVVITGECGPKALQALSAAGIKVFQGSDRTVKEALRDYQAGRLREIK